MKLPSGFPDTFKLILTGGCKHEEDFRARRRNQTNTCVVFMKECSNEKENKW